MKFVFFVIGCVFGIPLMLVLGLGGYIHGKHAWNKYRMDAMNDEVWEESVALVVTVEAELGGADGIDVLRTDIVCYEGYYAKPWGLKSGLPSAGMSPRSIGFEALQAEFTTGATLDISLRSLCGKAFRIDINELPQKFRHNEINILAPELSLTCSFHNHPRDRKYALQTDAGWVGHPYIVAIRDQPLQTLATRSEIGPSDRSSDRRDFRGRWGLSFNQSSWRREKACWDGRNGICNEAMTRYCGNNPR